MRMPPRRRRGSCLAPALLLAGLAGCSGADADTPQAALQTFYRALGAKDVAAACAVVGYDARPLQGDEIALCRSGFEAVVNGVASEAELAGLRAATVTGAQISGDHATIRADQISGVPEAYRQEATLIRSGGRWWVVTGR